MSILVRRSSIGALVATLACLLLAGPGAQSALAGPRPAGGDAPGAGRVDVVLDLVPRRPGIEALARSVSDPASSRYGRYVGPRETARRFGARRSTIARVRAFLRRRGVRMRVDVTRSFAQALVPARTARTLFGPIRGTSGRVPRELRGAVRAVLQEPAASGQVLPRRRGAFTGGVPDRREGGGPTGTQGPRAAGTQLAPPWSRTGTPAGCEQGRNATTELPDSPVAGPSFTPNQIQTAYGATPLHARGITGRGVRAAVIGANGFAARELRGFAACFGIDPPPARLVKVGTRTTGRTSLEAALDLQMLALMAPGLESLTVYDVGSGFWPVAFSSMLEAGNAPGGRLPHVISISEGECETELGRTQVALTERVLAATAAAGITVVAGSGDNGSFCSSGRVGFYPGSSQWVTSAGGTSLMLETSNRIADEVVWNDRPLARDPGDFVELAAGGGGFSRYLARPFYQRGLGGWRRGRGYPDVAMMADIFPGMAIYCGANERGECQPARAQNPFEVGFGTSAATPLVAGVVALANQRRLAAGAPPLGFVNPLLSRLGRRGGAGALRDVVEGSNDLGRRGCCRARPGYDLASGWGSLDAEGLARAARLGG